jgi:formylglycine-generating enzyme required for sulfatase activity
MFTTDRKLRVVLCYAPEDKFIIHDFHKRLSTESWIDLWLDEERILPGMNPDVEIARSVENADAVIVCVSHNSVDKEGYAQRELKLALEVALEKPEGAIFIIPLKVDQCQVPRSLRHVQYIDFSCPEDRPEAYSRLLKSLERQADLVNKRRGKTQSAHFVSPQNIRTQFDFIPLESCGFNFVRIPQGKFIIGSKASNMLARENEIPQRPYPIPYDYWISRFPISNEQFSEFAVSTKCKSALPKDWRKKLHHPTVNVSWHDAVSYTCWLNKVFGKEVPDGTVFRLPTEAEWERASRGDSSREHPWGNESLDELLQKEIFSGIPDMFRPISSQGIKEHKKEYQELKKKIEALRCTLNLTDVGAFSPLTDSPFKVADMMGSVIEWTQSLYTSYPYDAQDGREEVENEGERVIRGCFTSKNERFSVRSARRAPAAPNKKEPILGFRIVIAPPL